MKVLDKKLGAKRMAGVVGAVGVVAGGAFMGVENNRAKKRQAERDAKDDARWNERMEIMRQGFENAPKPPEYKPFEATVYTPDGTGKPTRTTLDDDWTPGSDTDTSGDTPTGKGDSPSTPVSSGGGGGSYDGTFQSVVAIAKSKGAKFPELVAAQWQLESGSGKHQSGKNNFFGQKGSGSSKPTQEWDGTKMVTVTDSFTDFETPEDSIGQVVNWWHKDYKDFKGANNASTLQEATQWLKDQNYATDPDYVSKLTRILKERGAL